MGFGAVAVLGCVAVNAILHADTESERARWLMLALLVAVRASIGFQFQTMGSVSESLVAQLGLSYTEIGTLIALFMLPGLVLSLPAGYLGRRFSDRILMSAGFGALAAGGAIAAFAHGFGQLALGRVAAGFGFVVSTIYLTKMLVDWFQGKKLGTAMSLFVMSWPLGIAMGQIGHAWVAENINWTMAFAVASAYSAVSALAIFLLYRPPVHAPRAREIGPIGLPRHELVLTMIAAVTWGLFNAGYVVYLSFAPQMLVAGGYGATQAAGVVSLGSWLMIFSGAAFGKIADRTGKPDLILYGAMAVAVAVMLLLSQTGLAVTLSLAFGLVGMAPAGIIMALAAEAMAPQRRAFGMGVYMTVYFVLQTASPPLAGWIFDRSGTPFGPLAFASALFAATAAGYLAFRRVQRAIARRQ